MTFSVPAEVRLPAETGLFPLDTIYFYVSGGCNLRCRHCYIAPRFEQPGDGSAYLDLDLMRSIIAQALPLGLQGVKLTGGEPLLHPQFETLLGIIAEHQLRLGIETNGVLISPSLAKTLAVFDYLHLSVSIDGAQAETHDWIRGVAGAFEAARTGISRLLDAGIRPQIIMSLMEHNRHEIEGVVRLAEGLGASSVKFNIVQPSARGEKLHRSGAALDVRSLLELGDWVENDLARQTPIGLTFDRPLAFRSLESVFGGGGFNCGICSILGILGVLSNGSYALCGIGEVIPAMIFGHAAQDPLLGVWRDSPVLNEIREGMPERLEGVCADCLVSQICMGSCIAQNFYAIGSLWGPFWFCDQAYQSGLFPETRLRPGLSSRNQPEIDNASGSCSSGCPRRSAGNLHELSRRG